MNNAIHWKNHYPVDSVVCYHSTYRWIEIHSVDTVIQPLNNCGLVFWEFFSSSFPLLEWFYIKRVVINVSSLQFFCLFFDSSPPDCLQQLLQLAFLLFKSGSCFFQELSVPCGSIILDWVPASCFYCFLLACVEQSLKQNLSNKTRNSTLSSKVLNLLQII